MCPPHVVIVVHALAWRCAPGPLRVGTVDQFFDRAPQHLIGDAPRRSRRCELRQRQIRRVAHRAIGERERLVPASIDARIVRPDRVGEHGSWNTDEKRRLEKRADAPRGVAATLVVEDRPNRRGDFLGAPGVRDRDHAARNRDEVRLRDGMPQFAGLPADSPEDSRFEL